MLVNTQRVRWLILMVPHWLGLLLGDLLHPWLLLIQTESINRAYTGDKWVLLLLHRLRALIELAELLNDWPLLGNARQSCWVKTDFLHNFATSDHAWICLWLLLDKHLLPVQRLLRICVDILNIVARLDDLIHFILCAFEQVSHSGEIFFVFFSLTSSELKLLDRQRWTCCLLWIKSGVVLSPVILLIDWRRSFRWTVDRG